MPCRDPTCYRGTTDRNGYGYKDGPCWAADCHWEGETRPHFTDTPSAPIVDAGKEALRIMKSRGLLFLIDD